MIAVAAGEAFVAYVASFPAGIAASVGVQILDEDGLVVLARTSAGIVEAPPASGEYLAHLHAPGEPGDYELLWDWDAGGPLVPSHTAAEELVVGAAPVAVPVVTPPPGSGDVTIPHFALPFRFTGAGRAVVNEQDSPDDIETCVYAVASYPVGSRVEKPDFGIPDQTFRQGGVDAAAVEAAVNRWEPRAQAAVTADNSSLASLIGRATVKTREAS